LANRKWAQKYRSKATHPAAPLRETPYGHLKMRAPNREAHAPVFYPRPYSVSRSQPREQSYFETPFPSACADISKKNIALIFSSVNLKAFV